MVYNEVYLHNTLILISVIRVKGSDACLCAEEGLVEDRECSADKQMYLKEFLSWMTFSFRISFSSMFSKLYPLPPFFPSLVIFFLPSYFLAKVCLYWCLDIC